MLLKGMLSNIMHYSGCHRLIEKRRLGSRAFVLMYHRVLPDLATQPHFVQPGMYVRSRSFEKHLQFLKDRYKVVFLEEIIDRLGMGADVGSLCAITFDDGWADNFSYAFPLLEKYKVPATIFLSTGYVGTSRMFWPEEVTLLLERLGSNVSAADAAPPVAEIMSKVAALSRRDRYLFLDSIVELLKKTSSADMEDFLAYLRTASPSSTGDRVMLSWDEVGKMADSGLVRFGAHTVNHCILDQISIGEARSEIRKSKVEIEVRTGYPVRTFAFPNGNHNTTLREVARDEGYCACVTTKKGLVGKTSPLFALPRIGVHEDVSKTVPLLASRILVPFY